MATIKEKYAQFGIEYDPKTNRIFCEPLGIWVKELLKVDTNTKVGNAATWSMLHGNEDYKYENLGERCRKVMDAAGIREIKGTCQCHCKGCYCDSGRYPTDTVRQSLLINTYLARFCLAWLKIALIAQINVRGIKQIRIHAAGDFFSIEYTEMWHDIIVVTRVVVTTEGDVVVQSWSYTKFEPAIHAFDDLPNMSMVESMTPVGVNYGTCREIIEKRKALVALGYSVHICACGTPYEKHCADCNVGCKRKNPACFTLFILHSVRDYVAGKNDPEDYAELLEIIRNQEN